MSVLHRILVSRHKRKKIFIKRKKIYKKFLGLKTFKAVMYTKLCLPYQPQLSKKKVTKARVKKLAAKKYRTLPEFPVLQSLLPDQRRREVALAQSDIAAFKNIISESPVQAEPEEKFQAFLPHSIWNNMTSEQRRAHIKKRKERAIKKLNKPASKYAFSNRRLRPMLNKLHFSARRQYLIGLIRFAAAKGTAARQVPFDQKMAGELSTRAVKSAVQASKKVRIKSSVYKILNYTSILPQQVARLVF